MLHPHGHRKYGEKIMRKIKKFVKHTTIQKFCNEKNLKLGDPVAKLLGNQLDYLIEKKIAQIGDLMHHRKAKCIRNTDIILAFKGG
jgi:hypothetical protein